MNSPGILKNKSKPLVLCIVWLAVVFLMAGCEGGTGPAGLAGPTGADGSDGQDLTAGPANEQCLLCHGSGSVADIKAMHAPSVTAEPVIAFNNLVDIRNQGPAELSGLAMTGTVDLVTITSGTVVVNFTVKDSADRGVTGLATTYAGTGSSAGQTLLAYMRFAIAKLVPGTSGSPDKWESYMVTSASRPTTENRVDAGYGVIVDNNDGSYTYTFAKNVTAVPGVTYDVNATHRMAIQISGGSSAEYPNIVNPLNIIRDFIPADFAGGTPTSRNIVAATACNGCHYKIGTTTPHSGRVDTKLCVVCHTYQRAIGRTATGPDADGVLTGSTYLISGQTGTIDGFAGLPQTEFVTFIHKIHRGEELSLTGYTVAGILLNEITFPQDIRNCAKCHTGPDGDNWKTKPSRKACGSCHDNISWLNPVPAGFIGHFGGDYADDAQCSVCHTPTAIADKHVPVAPPATTTFSGNVNAAYLAAAGVVPPGADQITYVVSSVTTTNNHPSIKFALKSSSTGTVVFSAPTSTTSELGISSFVGSPSVYFAWSVPQDGIPAPADFNASTSGYIKNIWNDAVNQDTSTTNGATITGPDGSGYYTITLTQVSVPSNAKMLTGGLGYTYSLPNTQPLTQTNLTEYPYNATTKIGGLIVPAPNVWKVATGLTGRRLVVDTAKCKACHGALGAAPTFHAGQRNDATTCSFCHTPNRTSSGWSANVSTYIHAIHGSAKRTVPFTWHAVSATENFSEITYPGLLNNCEQCHVPGGYDFSGSLYTANGGAQGVANMLFSTVATGTLASSSTNSFAFSPYVTLDTNYGNGFSYNAGTGVTTPAAGTTLVTSPISAACFACHDSSTAAAHMRANGGVIYQQRSSAIR